jgi:hypothetical protein
MQATAKVQGVEPPFDPMYVPSATDQALFEQQNGYDYKVLMDVVKDPLLKADLNKVPVGDGQKGWAAIKKKAEESTTTKNAAQCKMKYLSNVCIDDGSWQGTNEGFLDHWRALVMFARNTLLLLILTMSSNWKCSRMQ